MDADFNFKKVNKIEFKYAGTDLEGEFYFFHIIIDNTTYSFNDNYWEDRIPVCALLYDKVKNDKNYILGTEVNACFYHEYRIKKAHNGIVQLMLNFGSIKVKCEFEKQDLLKMLKEPLQQAANDENYLISMFDYEYDETSPEEREIFKQEYLDMLNKQIIPEQVLKNLESYPNYAFSY